MISWSRRGSTSINKALRSVVIKCGVVTIASHLWGHSFTAQEEFVIEETLVPKEICR